MLQKPDAHIEKLLKHADFLDQLEPERFSMKSWGNRGEPRCICGWLMHNEGLMNKDDWRTAANLLGMNEMIASNIFTLTRDNDDVSPKTAAKALRHYAVTGEFKGWR